MNNIKMASELIKVAKELIAFIYSGEVKTAMTDLLSQIEQHLGDKYVDAVKKANEGEYGFMKQIQYKIVEMVRDIGADAMLVRRRFPRGNQFKQQHRSYNMPPIKDDAAIWFNSLNDARAFTQARIALFAYVRDTRGINMNQAKLIM